MRKLAAVLAVTLGGLALALGAGCSSVGQVFDSKIDYKSAGQLPALEIPPDLTAPSRDSRFVLPESPQSATLSGYQQERKEQRPGASGVLPQVDNVRVERAGSERWLVVQEPAEKVWPVVRDFWLERGFLIKQESPEAGVLETDWAENRANLPQDFVRNLLGRFAEQVYSSAERDKFRTRLDRTPDGKGTEIYISHRGMREVYVASERGLGNEGRTKWEPREPDPGLEAEFLRRLMVRLGVQDERAKVAAGGGGPQQLRAELKKSSDGPQLLQVNEPFDRAWRRVGLALDRVGFTVEDRDRQNGLYFVRYADPEGEMQKKEAERGLLSRIFGTGEGKVKAEQFRVQVKPEKEASMVNVLNKDGGAETSVTAQRILALLHEQLK
jgi:outer membrane protein assembly factor BamC